MQSTVCYQSLFFYPTFQPKQGSHKDNRNAENMRGLRCEAYYKNVLQENKSIDSNLLIALSINFCSQVIKFKVFAN